MSFVRTDIGYELDVAKRREDAAAYETTYASTTAAFATARSI